MRLWPLVCAILIAAAGCAGSGWNQARREDNAAAYHRFLREHPRSHYAARARERLAFVQVRNRPSAEAYTAFRLEHPDSPLLAELRPRVEQQIFLRARAAGSVAAYRDFLADFPAGDLAGRARGNLAYLEQRGFGGRPEALAEFAADHAESDYAAEAERTVVAVAGRQQTAFDRVGLTVVIAPGTPGPERLIRVFTERARERYVTAGLELVPWTEAGDSPGVSPPVRLVVRHEEQEVRARLEQDRVAAPGILVRTSVTLARSDDGAKPIWSETFEFLAPASELRANESVLFAPTARKYWAEFFVPVSSWDSTLAVREPRVFEQDVVAVDAIGARTVVLFGDGGFQVLDLSDPAAPFLMTQYRRPRDLARFDGVRLLGGRVVVFGEDGVEIVSLAPDGARRVRALERGVVGSVVAAEPVEGGLVLASNRGLLFFDEENEALVRLVERPILGLARQAEHLLFTDGEYFFVSTLPLLRDGRVAAEIRIGKGFHPSGVRVRGGDALVLAERGLLRIDVRDPARPRIVSRVEATDVGLIHDATVSQGRLFLLGARGLQLADASGTGIVDSADVAARQRIRVTDRHLVMVGENALQVVDSTPFVTLSSPAASPEP